MSPFVLELAAHERTLPQAQHAARRASCLAGGRGAPPFPPTAAARGRGPPAGGPRRGALASSLTMDVRVACCPPEATCADTSSEYSLYTCSMSTKMSFSCVTNGCCARRRRAPLGAPRGRAAPRAALAPPGRAPPRGACLRVASAAARAARAGGGARGAGGALGGARRARCAPQHPLPRCYLRRVRAVVACTRPRGASAR